MRLVLIYAADPAAARPRAWITARMTLRFAQGDLVAVDQHWKFDEFFSDFIKHDYDKDKDGKLSAAEVVRIRDEAFVNLAEFSFLTHIRIGQRLLELKTFSGFKAHLETGDVVGEVSLPLPRPLDLTREPIQLGFHGETYHIDASFAEKNPLRFVGDAPEPCRYAIREDDAHPIYYGDVDPFVADVRHPAP